MGEEADADWDAGMLEAGREYVDNQIKDALYGGRQPKRRQTALRARGRTFETVEIGDDGKIIEPLRCTCGQLIVIHRPPCPFAGGIVS